MIVLIIVFSDSLKTKMNEQPLDKKVIDQMNI